WRVMLLCAALATSLTASADKLWSDSFDYQVGNLYSQGNWWRLAAATTQEPIQVVDDALIYPGYQTTAAGKAVQLVGTTDSSTKSERVKKQFAAAPVLEGAIFYSLLVKPMELPQTNTNKFVIAGLAAANNSGWDDGVGNTSPFATVSLAPGTEDGKFKFGYASSTAVPTYIDGEYDLGKTYLVVVKYDFDDNKKISIWINPADSTAEPTLSSLNGTTSPTYGLQGVCLYQQGSPNILGKIIVDHVRVATDMASLFVEDVPETPSTLFWSDSFNYNEGNLYGQDTWWRLSSTTTQEPIQVINDNLTYTGYQSKALGKAVQLVGTSNSSTKSERVKKQFSETPITSGELYYSMLVKPMEVSQDNTNKFIIAGFTGRSSSGWGDGIGSTGLYATTSISKGSEEGKFQFGFATSTSTPELIAEDLDLGKTYLIVVKYAYETKQVTCWVNPTSATDAPTKVLTNTVSISTTNGLQGLSLYQQGSSAIQGKIIVDNVRVAQDMPSLFKEETPGSAELSVTEQLDFTDVAAPINQNTKFATFTVEAKNLEAPASVWLGGADRANFSLSTTTIPAGSGSYEVVVTYSPTAIGKHSATVNFDATPTSLSSTHALTAAAYDPTNLPTITMPATVDAFSADPKETDVKTITISSANLFDYVYLALEDQSTGGTFQLNQGMLLPNGSDEVKITFAPNKPGDFTAKLKVYSAMVDTLCINLSGHSEGEMPSEPKQGGDLTLDTTSPLTYLVENFDVVTHNQPLDMTGWDNVAVTGPRAWWGYNFSTGEHGGAAKVTVYDSDADYDTPCEMLLVTPALDFKNAASKVFTCSVMGNFLPSAGTDEILEVLYIEDKDFMEPLQGLDIPFISDENNEWRDYVIDFDGQNLADVFFIGFRLKSYRGRNNSQTYYVDNVSWGRTDLPQVKADTRQLTYEAGLDATVTSPTINVIGLNLTDDIKIKVSGPDASFFTPSVTTLPAEGGALTLESTFTEEREYAAYVELTSPGSGAFLIEVYATASKTTGVTAVTAKTAATAAYDLMGRKVTAAQRLSSGLYIIDGKKVIK
ncbi:MAG: hypothetical protein HUK00_08495, partial [Bacteroidaceae bacterium]|nr:hypothetical protein [Bacteroidaceae bacterium]